VPPSVTSPDVIVAGEALIDVVAAPDGRIEARPGGGPFNTARTLGRLEVPVAFLGSLAEDRFGRQLRAALEADGVSLEPAVTSALPTTLAVAEIDPEGAATYRFYAEGTSAGDLPAGAALPEEAPWGLHLGTLGLVLEPMAASLAAFVERVAGRSLVMLDPNCRPSLLGDREAYRLRLERFLAGSDVVKVSVEDLEWLFPGAGPADGARGLLALGPAVALVTAGSEGAMVVTAEHERRVTTAPVAVVDTIGAGDAFGGGFLAAWRLSGRGREDLHDLEALAAATRFACLVAGLTCRRRGAVPPRLSELPDPGETPAARPDGA
jgi:fructokinase